MYGFITNNTWNCCDNPVPGQVVGYIAATQAQNLMICRKDGHGCNDNQGYCQLGLVNAYGLLTINLNFDADGNLWAIGTQTWQDFGTSTKDYGELAVSQNANTLTLTYATT